MNIIYSFKNAYRWMQEIRWFLIVEIILSQALSVIANPNYVFFSLIALTLGTMGVWIDLLPQGVPGLIGFNENVSRVAVFTFCIATLGNFATESYFDTNRSESDTDILKRSLGIFSWSVCLFLAFYSYVGSSSAVLGFWATLFFWVMANVGQRAFRTVNNKTVNNMVAKEGDAEEIGGAGL